MGAWDGFHVYVFSSKLKAYFSFKKRYSISNLGLVSEFCIVQSESHEVPMVQGCYVIPLFVKQQLLGT